MLKKLRTPLFLFLILLLLLGFIYPLFIFFFANFFFPQEANGSLVRQGDSIIGSVLIGQDFTSSPTYFRGRPSMTKPFPYNSLNSMASNAGPNNPIFLNRVSSRIRELKSLNPENKNLLPIELITASASGLDPDISPYAAYYQLPRIAHIRHLPEKELQKLIQRLTIPRMFGILGEPRVNVLRLNIALDALSSSRKISNHD